MFAALVVSSLAFRPLPLVRPALHPAPGEFALSPVRSTELICAADTSEPLEDEPALSVADDSCEPDSAEGKPSLAGEKAGVAIIAVVVAYALGAAGVTPGALWHMPGTLMANPILQKAASKTFKGGVSGAIAGVVQVLTLMWLRTMMNYQYRNGGSTKDAARALWKEGGIPRFYQGVQFAIFQTPLSRFGDTAANTGVLELLSMVPWGADLPIGLKTALASAAGSLWRILITPIDTLKTTLQVRARASQPAGVRPAPPLTLTLPPQPSRRATRSSQPEA